MGNSQTIRESFIIHNITNFFNESYNDSRIKNTNNIKLDIMKFINFKESYCRIHAHDSLNDFLNSEVEIYVKMALKELNNPNLYISQSKYTNSPDHLGHMCAYVDVKLKK